MKNNMKKVLFLTGVLCLASAGGVSAYLTDYDKVANQFTVGKVDVELKEDNWKPEEQKKIEPGKVIKKDPKISNKGINDAFVYLEVSIPMAEVTAVSDNGTRLEKKMQELFSFSSRTSWTKLNAQKLGSKQVYVFAYNKILKPQETTEPLFDMVKFLNIIEGQLDGQQLEIPVRAYAIQASYTGDSASSVQDQAKLAYQKYVNQNKNQPGKVTE
ncbi:SipW-dependent-type signal peptide-containing protein [Blautia sp. MSJ-19]|nr:SipW-dependent-type signal peptide-containing protein [Blautia sp. MSJ-19]